MSKRCWTMVHCPLHSKCAMAHMPYTNGQFQPTNVGEFCHNFQPLVFSDVTKEEEEAWGALSDKMGNLE